MTEFKTEEEQVEQLKQWWKDHGNKVVTGVALVCAVWVGARWWQNEQRVQSETASNVYEELLDAVLVAEPTEAQERTAMTLMNTLQEDHADSTYAQMAALFSAKAAVKAGDLAKAEKDLSWVLENKPEDELKLITQARLARVQFGQEKYDEALAQLTGAEGSNFEASYEEIRGDIYYAQGDLDRARRAYQKADLIAKEKSERRPNLKMKLDNLTVADASKETAAVKVDSKPESPAESEENTEESKSEESTDSTATEGDV